MLILLEYWLLRKSCKHSHLQKEQFSGTKVAFFKKEDRNLCDERKERDEKSIRIHSAAIVLIGLRYG